MPGSTTVTAHTDRDIHPNRAVAPPIYQTAAFRAEDAHSFAQAAVDARGKAFCTRFGNPNHAQVAAVVAELEHTEAAMVTASGIAALTTTPCWPWCPPETTSSGRGPPTGARTPFATRGRRSWRRRGGR
ncbi:PLP-dependent transferase [Streptomyces sp. NPDC002523]